MKLLKSSWIHVIVVALLGAMLSIVITNRKNQTVIVFEEKNNVTMGPTESIVESEKRKRGFEIIGGVCILLGTLLAFVSWLLHIQSSIQSAMWEYFVGILAVAIISLGGNLLAQSFVYRKIK